MHVSSDRGRFAERVLHGVDDVGNDERVVIWIERMPGAVWGVGRAVNPEQRNDSAPRKDDYIFEGYELDDALEQANAALEDDLTVSEADGRPEHLRPFTRDELLKPLEAWFFGALDAVNGIRSRAMLVRVGFSADPDDAFMFWGLSSGTVDARGYEFEPVIADIQSLNEWSLEGRLEVTAMSLATYPLVHERYALLPHGASIGSGYGPIVVAPEQLTLDELRAEEIVVPGKLTTAFLVLQLALGGEFACRVLPFDEILDEVASGRARAGLLIHEGQLTYGDAGVTKCLDLGEWWLLETGLPLPLGVNTIRRDLGAAAMTEVSGVLRASIDAALAHRDEALEYALGFGRGLDDARGDQFIDMYVNELTLDYGDEGRQAVRELLERAHAGIQVQWVE